MLEAVRQCFGDALPFIVTGARPYRVDMAPAPDESRPRVFHDRQHLLVFVLRVYFRVAVYFYEGFR